ncbi:MAG TPA: rod shape-determining protein MreC, partial [Luteimonas sp.]|nr:rod shape-determining protein MreC [Luteimonas sp.]
YAARVTTLAAPAGRAPGARRVLLLIDGSRSMKLVGEPAVAAVVRAIGAALPAKAEIEGVIFDRTPARILGEWRPADAATLRSIDEAVRTHPSANGSDAAGALTLAHNLIADTRGEAMIIVISDGVFGGVPDDALVKALASSELAADVYTRLTEQNQRLREDLLLANAKLNRMAAVAEQNTRLKELLDTQHSLDLNVQLARVIGVDLGAYRYRLTLNVGARDGVRPGQPVIDAHGVLGQVREVLPTTATVMLVTDPTHALPVVIERSGLRTVAYGSRDGGALTLPNIPLAADVKAGDHLLTSGLGGRFPPGFPVGEISAVAPAASGMFQEARATPAADIDRSDDVLLLHDLAEPQGPPAPVTPVGPAADLSPTGDAPAAATSARPPRAAPVSAPPAPAGNTP